MTQEAKADYIHDASKEYWTKVRRKQSDLAMRKFIAKSIAVRYGIDPEFFIKLVVHIRTWE